MYILRIISVFFLSLTLCHSQTDISTDLPTIMMSNSETLSNTISIISATDGTDAIDNSTFIQNTTEITTPATTTESQTSIFTNTPTTTEPQTTPKSKNLGLILGLSLGLGIPVLLGIVAGIIFYCHKQGKARRGSNYQTNF
ncbi:hypothetical protein I4U23_020272 [Adineta vaga]|nr:hypothetical protein I4U23_020272 [Adineta vaga]